MPKAARPLGAAVEGRGSVAALFVADDSAGGAAPAKVTLEEEPDFGSRARVNHTIAFPTKSFRLSKSLTIMPAFDERPSGGDGCARRTWATRRQFPREERGGLTSAAKSCGEGVSSPGCARATAMTKSPGRSSSRRSASVEIVREALARRLVDEPRTAIEGPAQSPGSGEAAGPADMKEKMASGVGASLCKGSFRRRKRKLFLWLNFGRALLDSALILLDLDFPWTFLGVSWGV